MYDPAIGRFLQRDPTFGSLTNPLSLNRFGYALDNPVLLADPSGLSANKVTQNSADDNECFSNGGGALAGNVIYANCLNMPMGAQVVYAVVGTPPNLSVVQTVVFAKPGPGGGGDIEQERNPAQDEMLSPAEIKKLEDFGIDIHEEKGGKGASKRDLYKDTKGNVYVKPKGGRGPGDPLYINLNDIP